MVDREHEEWLRDEALRKQSQESHRLGIKKIHSTLEKKKKARLETDEAQEEEDDAADDAADEQEEEEREDGLQGGLAV